MKLIPSLNLENALLFVVLFLYVFQMPQWVVVADSHDAGAQAALEYWTLHHYQYGKEIVQNVGPLGFINYPKLYTGFLDSEKLILNLILTGLFAFLALTLSNRLPGAYVKYSALINAALFSSLWFQDGGMYHNADVMLYLLLLFIGYMLLATDGIFVVSALAAVLALLSLAKGTLLIISFAVITLTCAQACVRKKFLKAGILPAAFALCLAGFWEASGQEMTNLPVFLGNMLSLTKGYSSGYIDSMFVYADRFSGGPYETGLAIAAALLAGLAIAAKALGGLRQAPLGVLIQRWAHTAVEFFILFIVWRHSIIRHTLAFFNFLVIAAIFYFWLPFSSARAGAGFSPALKKTIYAAISLICYAGIAEGMAHFPYASSPEIMNNIYFIEHPREYAPQLRKDLTASVSAMQLPHMRATVGDKGMGYFGFLPAPAVYNGFSYKPMPNTISFTGWSHESMENDASFYRDDASAPPFLLYAQQTIDDRISAQDDAPAQLEILAHYDPVLDAGVLAEEKNLVLLRRRNVAAPLTYQIFQAQEYALGQWIDVPQSSSPLRLKVRVPESMLARVIKTVYRPPEYAIDYMLSDGRMESRKFMARMAADGFLVAPFIDDNHEFLAVFSHAEYEKYLSGESSALSRIRKFRIRCAHLAAACSQTVSVSFETVNGLELGRLHFAGAPLK